MDIESMLATLRFLAEADRSLMVQERAMLVRAAEAIEAASKLDEALTAQRAAGGSVSPRVAMAQANLRKLLNG